MKRLGFYVGRLSYGGGERVKNLLIQEFYNRGYDIYIYTHDSSVSNNFKTPHTNIVLPKYNNLLIQLFSDIAYLYLKTKPINLDLMVVFGFHTRFIVISHLLNIPTLQAIRTDPNFGNRKLLGWFRRKICFKFASKIVFQTNKIKQRYSDKIQSKSIVIPNPIIDLLPDPSIKRQKIIVSAGRLSKEKNLPMLIKAFADANPPGYILNIYGEGPEREQLKMLITQLELNEKIFLKGRVEKIVEHIKSSEIFLISSDFEGMPNSLIEAMAMGIASISTSFPSGAAEDLITNKENGIIVPKKDIKQMSKAITMLVNDNILRKKIQNQSIDIRKKLEKNLIINQWIQIIDKILNKNNVSI